MKWLEENFGLENVISSEYSQVRGKCFLRWPPHSPDLNPLDFSIWHLLKTSALKKVPGGIFLSRKQCIAAVKKAWAEIDQEHVYNACTFGVLHKAQDCILVHGSSTKNYSKKRHGPRPVIVDPPLCNPPFLP